MDEVILTAWYALLETAVGKLREQFPYTGVTGGGELSPMGGTRCLNGNSSLRIQRMIPSCLIFCQPWLDSGQGLFVPFLGSSRKG